MINHIDEIAEQYINASSFIIIATEDGTGNTDVSPKGDPAGFVKILDKNHIAIPDRPGNRRLDTLQNILKNPNVAILFLVPGTGETLRVYGEARIVQDAKLLESMAINGRDPLVAVVVHVTKVMIHCPKCIIRSDLWSNTTSDTPPLPEIGQAMAVHAHLTGTPQEQEKAAEDADVLKLY